MPRYVLLRNRSETLNAVISNIYSVHWRPKLRVILSVISIKGVKKIQREISSFLNIVQTRTASISLIRRFEIVFIKTIVLMVH